MKIPGMRFVRKAERTGNEVEVPMADNLGLVHFLKRTFKEASEDHLAAFAGNLTYKGLFALFPFFVFLLSLLGIFGAPDLLGQLLDRLSAVLPQDAAGFLQGQLVGIAQSKAESAFTVGAIVSILLALWGVSGAFRSVMEAMNVMYEVEEGRPFYKLRPRMLVITAAFLIMVTIAAILLVVSGPIAETIGDTIGLGSTAVTV